MNTDCCVRVYYPFSVSVANRGVISYCSRPAFQCLVYALIIVTQSRELAFADRGCRLQESFLIQGQTWVGCIGVICAVCIHTLRVSVPLLA